MVSLTSLKLLFVNAKFEKLWSNCGGDVTDYSLVDATLVMTSYGGGGGGPMAKNGE